MKKIIITTILALLFWKGVYAINEDILDQKIAKFCYKHELADKLYWVQTHWLRCTLILQGQIRHETLNCTIWNWLKNNCFWFRGNKRTDWEKEYWMYYDWTWSYRFNDKTWSIRFAVDRYYKYDRYKTITQIIKWGWYCSPVTWWCGKINWFARTTEEKYNNYIYNVRQYFKTNVSQLSKQYGKNCWDYIGFNKSMCIYWTTREYFNL